MLFAVKPGLTAEISLPRGISPNDPLYERHSLIKLTGLDSDDRPFHLWLQREEFLALFAWWNEALEKQREKVE